MPQVTQGGKYFKEGNETHSHEKIMEGELVWPYGLMDISCLQLSHGEDSDVSSVNPMNTSSFYTP